MARQITADQLCVGDVYRIPGGRTNNERLRKVSEVRNYTSGTLPMVIIENLDPRTDTRVIGAVSLLKTQAVEVVTPLEGDEWEDWVLSQLDILPDGRVLRIFAVGTDLYA